MREENTVYIIYTVLHLADALSTWYGVTRGLGVEGNTIIAGMIATPWKHALITIVGLAIMLAVIFVTYRVLGDSRLRLVPLAWIIGMKVWTVANNMLIILGYYGLPPIPLLPLYLFGKVH